MTYNRMEAKPIARRALPVLWRCLSAIGENPMLSDSGYVAIRRFFHVEVTGVVRSSTSALVCVIPIMKINMVALGKAVRNAAISGRREITKT